MGLRFSLPPFLRTNTRMLWSGVFLPTSSRAFGGTVGPWPSGGKAGSLGWTGGSPPLGAACLGTACPTLHWGQTVLEGHDFWRQWETVFVFLQLSGILLHSQLLWASKFSQKSPCKSHQITAGDVWWHGSEVNLSFIKRKRRSYIHLVCVPI